MQVNTVINQQEEMQNEYNLLSEQEKHNLSRILADAIIYYIESDIAVYIDNFGLLLPQRKTEDVVRYYNEHALIRSETTYNIIFEKCTDLTSYHRKRFGKIVDIRELSKRVHPRLPLALSIKWDQSTLRLVLSELLKQIKEETVYFGSSNRLQTIGTFYGLHNRQGDNLKDWIAGSDFFLEPTYKQLLKAGPAKMFQPPTFEDAWEPLICAYGDPLATFSIRVREELNKLGYSLPTEQEPTIQVAAFERTLTDGDTATLYCTNGLRNSIFKGNIPSGVEFVFQIRGKQDLDIATQPSRAFALGWILLNGSRTGMIVLGVGLNCQSALSEQFGCKLTAIFTTDFAQIRHPANSPQGTFTYINLVGITDTEAALLEKSNASHLLAILKYKNSDQITRLDRSCLIGRSKFSPSSEAYNRFFHPSQHSEIVLNS